MEEEKTSFIKKLSILTIGVIIMSFGIAMYLKAGLGTDPITTFTHGSSIFLNISIGRASQITMSIILVIIFFVDKKRIGLGAFFNTFLTGELLNLFMRLPIESSNFGIRIIILSIGIISFGIGVALFIISNLGAGPVDIIMSMAIDKFGISLEKARIILDIVLVIVGYLLGAPIGIGTIFGVMLTGTVIARTLDFENKYKILQVNKNVQS